MIAIDHTAFTMLQITIIKQVVPCSSNSSFFIAGKGLSEYWGKDTNFI